MFYSTLILTICFVLQVQSAKLPSYLKTCHTSDPEWTACAKKHAVEAIPNIVKGDKKYGIPAMNPFKIEKVTIDASADLLITLNNLSVTGFETAELLDAKIDDKQLEFFIGFKYLDLQGTYNVDGRILQLPITGNGPMSLKTTNSKFRVNYKWKYVTKDGEQYLDIKDAQPVLSHENIVIKLENLFNGDKELGDRTNKLINDNWRELNEEINPSVIRVVRTLCTQIIGGITSKVPVKNIFPK